MCGISRAAATPSQPQHISYPATRSYASISCQWSSSYLPWPWPFPTLFHHWQFAWKSHFNCNKEFKWRIIHAILFHLEVSWVENLTPSDFFNGTFFQNYSAKCFAAACFPLSEYSILHPKASPPLFCRIREAGWTHLNSIHIFSLLCNSIYFLRVVQFYIWATSPYWSFNSDLIGFYHSWYHRCVYHVCLLSLHTFSNSLLACFPFKAKGQLASVTLALTADRCHPQKLPSELPSKLNKS